MLLGEAKFQTIYRSMLNIQFQQKGVHYIVSITREDVSQVVFYGPAFLPFTSDLTTQCMLGTQPILTT